MIRLLTGALLIMRLSCTTLPDMHSLPVFAPGLNATYSGTLMLCMTGNPPLLPSSATAAWERGIDKRVTGREAKLYTVDMGLLLGVRSIEVYRRAVALPLPPFTIHPI